ncbi:unnamed protein product [Cylindrotheca closterium]|uniref:Glycosyltransferase 2-like domain-containing protein n=1 Tax=Cylindrotheca closterium TaxID=2856 RepID=A0AAD2JKA3_9STRA|nr:unnamed protein product [Cylindrotheca closterium]
MQIPKIFSLALFPILCNSLVTAPPRLVVLIPAYNEADRIGSTLESYRNFLSSQDIWQCEILVVDDGSSDSTSQVVKRSADYNKRQNSAKVVPVDCVSLSRNQGKGGALSRGIRHVADANPGNDDIYILTQDADGSGDLTYLNQMYGELQILQGSGTTNKGNAPALVTGNRNYSLFSPRGVTRWGFQTCVSVIMGGLGVQDSQCGYKLMTLPAACLLYKDLHLKGWAHDVEVLYRAKLMAVPVAQISIDWLDKEGSKVLEAGVANVSAQMLRDVLRLRWEYSITGAWKLPKSFHTS